MKVHRKIQRPGPELVWVWVGGYVGGWVGNSVGWHLFIYLCLVFTEHMQVSILLRTTFGSDFQLFRLKCRSEVKVSEFKCQVTCLKCYKLSGRGTSNFLFLKKQARGTFDWNTNHSSHIRVPKPCYTNWWEVSHFFITNKAPPEAQTTSLNYFMEWVAVLGFGRFKFKIRTFQHAEDFFVADPFRTASKRALVSSCCVQYGLFLLLCVFIVHSFCKMTVL